MHRIFFIIALFFAILTAMLSSGCICCYFGWCVPNYTPVLSEEELNQKADLAIIYHYDEQGEMVSEECSGPGKEEYLKTRTEQWNHEK